MRIVIFTEAVASSRHDESAYMTIGMALLCVMGILANTISEGKEEEEKAEKKGGALKTMRPQAEPGNEKKKKKKKKKKKGGALKTERSQAEPGNEGVWSLGTRGSKTD